MWLISFFCGNKSSGKAPLGSVSPMSQKSILSILLPNSTVCRRVIFRRAHLMTGFDNLQQFADCSAFASDHGGAIYDSAPSVLRHEPAFAAVVAAALKATPGIAAMTDVWGDGRDTTGTEAQALVILSPQLEAFKSFFARRLASQTTQR